MKGEGVRQLDGGCPWRVRGSLPLDASKEDVVWVSGAQPGLVARDSLSHRAGKEAEGARMLPSKARGRSKDPDRDGQQNRQEETSACQAGAMGEGSVGRSETEGRR